MVRLGIHFKEEMIGFTDGLNVTGRENRECFLGLWYEQLVCGGRKPRERNREVENTLYLEQNFCFCRCAGITDND